MYDMLIAVKYGNVFVSVSSGGSISFITMVDKQTV